jgi:hypothetical protein
MPGVSSTFKTGHTRGNGDTGHKGLMPCVKSSYSSGGEADV